MPDGLPLPSAGPLLLDEKRAADHVSMTLRDFRVAVSVGLLPAGRTPADFAGAGLIAPEAAARLAGLGPLWHRLEIETRAAALFGLEGQAAVRQAAGIRAAHEALDAYQPAASRRA